MSINGILTGYNHGLNLTNLSYNIQYRKQILNGQYKPRNLKAILCNNIIFVWAPDPGKVVYLSEWASRCLFSQSRTRVTRGPSKDTSPYLISLHAAKRWCHFFYHCYYCPITKRTNQMTPKKTNWVHWSWPEHFFDCTRISGSGNWGDISSECGMSSKNESYGQYRVWLFKQL